MGYKITGVETESFKNALGKDDKHVYIILEDSEAEQKMIKMKISNYFRGWYDWRTIDKKKAMIIIGCIETIKENEGHGFMKDFYLTRRQNSNEYECRLLVDFVSQVSGGIVKEKSKSGCK